MALQTKAEIVQTLKRLQRDAPAFWAQVDSDRFAAPIGNGWSAAENVRHLIQSIAPVTLALRLPTWLPRLLFGVAKAPSDDLASIENRYAAALRAGGGAGRFTPKRPTVPADAVGWKGKLLAELAQSIERLRAAVDRWTEGDLERIRLPHPLLGKLTVREMLLFTIVHLAHHERKVAARLDPRGEIKL